MEEGDGKRGRAGSSASEEAAEKLKRQVASIRSKLHIADENRYPLATELSILIP